MGIGKEMGQGNEKEKNACIQALKVLDQTPPVVHISCSQDAENNF